MLRSRRISTVFEDVFEFHRKFKLLPQDKYDFSEAVFQFRFKFMQEELKEFEEAYKDKDREKQFDAMLDLIYVAVGTIVMMDILPEDAQEGWRRVHDANMTKVRARVAADSRRLSPLDVIKPDGFEPPDHSDLV